MPYDPSCWYWAVASSPGMVFSSCSMTAVPETDSDYVAWSATNQPTRIASQAALNEVLLDTVLSRGVEIVSSSTPALNGTYACAAGTQSSLMAVSQCITVTGAFPGGGAVLPWLDLEGTLHTFTTAQFQQFAVAIAGYVASVMLAAQGLLPTIPAANITVP